MLCICHDLGVVHKLRYHFWGICLPDGQGNLSKSEFFRNTLCAYNFEWAFFTGTLPTETLRTQQSEYVC